jgi:3',5'-cyclic AMP phosphodiesterase CpdA
VKASLPLEEGPALETLADGEPPWRWHPDTKVSRAGTTVPDMHIALIADSHVSARAPECVDNWNRVACAMPGLDVALTVHLGDITLDGERYPEEIDYAADLIERWPTPIRCVPGNHDVGTGSGEERLSTNKLSRYERALGADRWVVREDGWVLFGLNAQLLGSGTFAEAMQWAWLEQEAAVLDPHDRVVLFLHRPVVRAAGDRWMPTGRYVHAEGTRRLLGGPLRNALRLVVSGHTHQALEFTSGSVRHVWVPSSGFVINDAMQPPVGRKVVGIGLLVLERDGFLYERHLPSGMREHELTALGCFAASA